MVYNYPNKRAAVLSCAHPSPSLPPVAARCTRDAACCTHSPACCTVLHAVASRCVPAASRLQTAAPLPHPPDHHRTTPPTPHNTLNQCSKATYGSQQPPIPPPKPACNTSPTRHATQPPATDPPATRFPQQPRLFTPPPQTAQPSPMQQPVFPTHPLLSATSALVFKSPTNHPYRGAAVRSKICCSIRAVTEASPVLR
jgi:hypothetical protein